MSKTKPLAISKRAVWEAYRQVKENRGAAGVNRQSLEDFEQDLANSRKIKMSRGKGPAYL